MLVPLTVFGTMALGGLLAYVATPETVEAPPDYVSAPGLLPDGHYVFAYEDESPTDVADNDERSLWEMFTDALSTIPAAVVDGADTVRETVDNALSTASWITVGATIVVVSIVGLIVFLTLRFL